MNAKNLINKLPSKGAAESKVLVTADKMYCVTQYLWGFLGLHFRISRVQSRATRSIPVKRHVQRPPRMPEVSH